MVAIPGTFKDNEFWVRCPFCGDSSDSRRAHFSINMNGLYHCLRCGKGGKLTTKEFVQFTVGYLDVPKPTIEEEMATPHEDVQSLLRRLRPGAGTQRDSALARFHVRNIPGVDHADAFLARDQYGGTIGIALAAQSFRKFVGSRGLGYTGEVLQSTASDPLRVVEGPYDVLNDRYCAVFGLPTLQHLQLLRGQFIILTPDGDVWTDTRKHKRITSLVDSLRTRRLSGPILLGVEILPPDHDPDEVPESERRFVSFR